MPEEIEPFARQYPQQMLSVGLHPWYIAHNYLQALDTVATYAIHPSVYAIGECGIDKLTETPLPLQEEIFIKQALIAEKAQKPLIIHSVKTYNEIIHLKKELKPHAPWILHGFRGKTSIAQELIHHQFCLSFGNTLIHIPNVVRYIPLEKIFFETDDATVNIEEVYQNFSKLRGITIETLKAQIDENFKRTFLKNSTC